MFSGTNKRLLNCYYWNQFAASIFDTLCNYLQLVVGMQLIFS